MRQIDRITFNLVWSWGPCVLYSRQELEDILGSDGLTPIEVADHTGFTASDKLFVLLHPEVMPVRDIRLLVCRWAREMLPLFEQAHPHDKRPRTAIEVAERYAKGNATLDELATARVQAADAANGARKKHGRTSAPRVGAASARTAAKTAALAAGTPGAWEAAWQAATEWIGDDWEDKRGGQLADVRAVLQGAAVEDLPPREGHRAAAPLDWLTTGDISRQGM